MKKALLFLTLRLINFLLVFSVLFCCGVSLLSCNYFSEPEPTVNKKLDEPKIKPYPMLATQIGDTVKDITNVEFVPEGDSLQITTVRLFIDWDFVSSLNAPPYKFSVDTKLWKNGSHFLQFGIDYKQNPTLGLSDLINMPSVLYRDTVEFLHAPASPINITIGHEKNHPTILWSHQVESDVRYYIVRRYNSLGQVSHIDSVSLFSANIFTDYFDTAYIGKSVYYDVGAGNDLGINYSGIVIHKYGVSVTKAFGYLFINNVVDEGDTIITIQGKSDYWRLSGRSALVIDDVFGISTIASRIEINFQKTRMYYYSPEYPQHSIPAYLFAINYNTPIYQKVILNGPTSVIDLAVGLEERLYMVDQNGKLWIYDGITANFIDTLQFLSQGTPFMKVAYDGAELLVVDSDILKIYSLGENNINLISQTNLGGNISDWRFLWPHNEIIINRAQSQSEPNIRLLDLWNYKSLSKRTIPNPIESSELTAITTNQKNIYAAYKIQKDDGYYTLLIEYDAITQNRIQQWIIKGIVSALAVSQKGKFLFVGMNYNPDQIIWAVDITGGDPL